MAAYDLVDCSNVLVVTRRPPPSPHEADNTILLAHRPRPPVQVVFTAYRNTLQAAALTFVARKLQS